MLLRAFSPLDLCLSQFPIISKGSDRVREQAKVRECALHSWLLDSQPTKCTQYPRLLAAFFEESCEAFWYCDSSSSSKSLHFAWSLGDLWPARDHVEWREHSRIFGYEALIAHHPHCAVNHCKLPGNGVATFFLAPFGYFFPLLGGKISRSITTTYQQL